MPFRIRPFSIRRLDDDYLVGRPLTIGNFVSQSGLGAIFTRGHEYIHGHDRRLTVIGDDALPDSELPEAITGTPYQEVLTNFPVSNQILSGSVSQMRHAEWTWDYPGNLQAEPLSIASGSTPQGRA